MNTSNRDIICSLDIAKDFYTLPHLRIFFFPLAVLNSVMDACLPITSVGGSAFLIAAVIKFPQLREVPSNLLLASQAVSDLLVGLLVQPLLTAVHVGYLRGNCLTSREFLKSFFTYWIHALLFSSGINICFITVDRYISIVYPLRHVAVVTERRVFRAIIANWLFSLLFAGVQVVPIFPETTARLFSIIPLVLLLSVTFFCYFKITRIARRHKRQLQGQTKAAQVPINFQSSKTAVMMVGVVILCYVPGMSVVVGLYANKNIVILEAVKPFVTTLVVLNSSINPLVYYMRSRKIRRCVWKVIKCEKY